jgi:eukaryotic-like serine/threonine-protein kinase
VKESVQKPTLPIPSTSDGAGAGAGWSPGTPTSGGFAGRYEIMSRLGVGGMAEVVLARDRALGRLVALKLLAPALAVDPLFVERFRREATAIASLNHPGIVVIYDHGVAEGQPYIAMEYVAGRSLKQIIAESGPLAPGTAVAYACQMLAGLAAAHAVGIVHRDIKPQNLIVRDDGTLKVADFGVARSADETVLTQLGAVIGTADYISPEQARGEIATPASDLYSAGVVLFEMLTGTLPFTGELPVAVASQHISTPAPSLRQVDPAVPVALANVVTRALAKERSGRFDSAAAMKAALEASLAEPAIPPRAAPTARLPATAVATQVLPPAPRAAARTAWRLPRRSVLVVGLAAVALLAGLALALTTRSGGGARSVALPRVIGRPVASAVSALRARGFVVRTLPAVHANRAPGTVAAVRPNTASADLGTTIGVIPSSGPSLIAIPRVAGFSESAAIAALERLGLGARPQTAYGPTPSGTVVGTAPPAGTSVPPGSAVAITISAGPAPVAPAKPVPPDHAKGPKGGGHGKGHEKPKEKHRPRA